MGFIWDSTVELWHPWNPREKRLAIVSVDESSTTKFLEFPSGNHSLLEYLVGQHPFRVSMIFPLKCSSISGVPQWPTIPWWHWRVKSMTFLRSYPMISAGIPPCSVLKSSFWTARQSHVWMLKSVKISKHHYFKDWWITSKSPLKKQPLGPQIYQVKAPPQRPQSSWAWRRRRSETPARWIWY